MAGTDVYAFPRLEPGIRAGGGTAAERAAHVVAAAEADAAAIRAAAERAGREEGFANGLAEARDRLTPGEQALASAADAVREAQHALAADLERQAVELALAIAEKVIATSLEVRPELVLDVVTGALRRVVERERLTLLVNPDDLELVSASLDDIASAFGGIEHIDVASERRVGRGGCVVRTAEGELDASVSEQLTRAGEVLRGVLAPG